MSSPETSPEPYVRPKCERCGIAPRWDIFTLCRQCHAEWVCEQQEATPHGE